MALDEFRRYWFEVREPIVRSLPGLIHYQQSVEPEEAHAFGDVRWNGVEEIRFDSLESARKTLKWVEYERSFLLDFRKILRAGLLFLLRSAVSHLARREQRSDQTGDNGQSCARMACMNSIYKKKLLERIQC
jgi:hypothetical protein